MRKSITILLVLASCSTLLAHDFDTALDLVGKRIAYKIYNESKNKVAIMSLFDHHGNPNELGGLVADELTVAMLKHSLGFEIMDRNHLDVVFKEHKLALGGLVNDSTIIQLGKLESVQVVITGTIARLGNRYKVTLKALDTETAMVVAADKEYFDAEPFLDEYYGLEIGASEPVPTKPIRPVLDCSTGNYGEISLRNSYAFPVLVVMEVESPSSDCHDRISLEVPPGTTAVQRAMCAGSIHYICREIYTGTVLSQGSTYLSTCGTVSLGL